MKLETAGVGGGGGGGGGEKHSASVIRAAKGRVTNRAEESLEVTWCSGCGLHSKEGDGSETDSLRRVAEGRVGGH